MIEIQYQDLNKNHQELLDKAELVMVKSYNPYSHFSVGAALRLATGDIITGTNYENAALGSTICAERAAIVSGNSQGFWQYEAIAIIARGKDFDTTEVTGPCGSCRQVLYEAAQISGQDLTCILSTTNKDKIILTSIEKLLPLGFGPKELGVDIELWRNKNG